MVVAVTETDVLPDAGTLNVFRGEDELEDKTVLVTDTRGDEVGEAIRLED